MQPIHFATCNDHADIVDMLIEEYGADIHAKTQVVLISLHSYFV